MSDYPKEFYFVYKAHIEEALHFFRIGSIFRKDNIVFNHHISYLEETLKDLEKKCYKE